ncbi:protein jag [Sporosarcina sp. P12(2017)]|uniref:RNA-binding cell elongation regulator Jag/EloR n=1 Tax=unclassified Sporosarcina TaxID=2647733 RepID=UPI000C164305|nr:MULTISPECIES: RNA-binding cell elongation regulator Jag/EloR [unclassified Sporosarcina]PIC57200.1 protein jag [Sporosarcina sp. P10]PIC60582.1 protein jag [Sporosarcina sp. P12(2017)]
MKQLTQRAATVELAIESALQDLGVTKEQVEIQVVENGRKGFLGFGVKQAEVLVTVLEKSKPNPKPAIARVTEPTQTITDDSEVLSSVTKAPQVVQQPQNKAKPLENVVDIKESERVPEAKIYNEKDAIEETKQYIEDMAKEMGIEDLVITYETKGKYINFQLESEKAAFLIGKRGQTLNAIQQLAQLVANKVTKQFKIVRIDVADYRERREQSLEQLADRMADRAVRTKRQVALEPMPSYERKVIHNALSLRLDIETFSEGKDPYRHIVIKGIE